MAAPIGHSGYTGQYFIGPAGAPGVVAGATGAAGGTVLMQGDALQIQPTPERGYEPAMHYRTAEPDRPVVTSAYTPPSLGSVGLLGLEFAVAIATLVVAWKLRLRSIRFLMLVLVVGQVVLIVLLE
jgi:hypothetical protein